MATPAPTTAFTISSPSQSPTSIAAGQTVALRFNVESAQAASNVDVYVVVQHAGGPDVRLDVGDLTFSSGETKTIRRIEPGDGPRYARRADRVL